MRTAKHLDPDQGRLGTKELRVNRLQGIPTNVTVAVPVDSIEHVGADLVFPECRQHPLQDALCTPVDVLISWPETRLRLGHDLFDRNNFGGGGGGRGV